MTGNVEQGFSIFSSSWKEQDISVPGIVEPITGDPIGNDLYNTQQDVCLLYTSDAAEDMQCVAQCGSTRLPITLDINRHCQLALFRWRW